MSSLLKRASELLRDEDRRIVAGLVLFTLAFRLLTLMMIATGIDERDYWFSARRLLLGLPYDNIQHRTIRFAVILPVLAAQALFGTHPDVYYVVPLVLSLVQVALIYRVGLRLHGRAAGFVAALMLVTFPYMIRGGSQVRPDSFSLTYVLASFSFFLAYLDGERDRTRNLLVSSVFLFVAYQAKITNIYFAPGFLLAILAFRRGRGRGRRDALLFCAPLLVLYAVEHALLYRLSGDPLGQIGIIIHNHFTGDYIAPMDFWGLFGRFSPGKLPWYWMAVLLLAAAAAVRYAVRRKPDAATAALLALAASFLLGETFVVKSIHPVIPVEPFIHRYLLGMLGPVLLLDAPLLVDVWRRVRPAAGPLRARSCASLMAAVLLAAAGAFSIPGLPRSVRIYANNPLRPSEHPLALVEDYRRTVSDAFDRGVPVVATDDLSGRNPLETCAQFFVSDSVLEASGLPRLVEASLAGRPVVALARAPVSAAYLRDPGSPVVAVRRNPLRAALTVVAAAPPLIREDSRSQED